MNLTGQRVVVIGGTSGIGLAVARTAAEDGASVVVASRTKTRIDAALESLPEGVRGEQVDVSDEYDVREFFARVGAFDHLAYTAGDHIRIRPITDIPLDEAKAFFGTMYWGAFTAAKHAVGVIRPAGSITFTSGIISVRPAPGTSAQSGVTAAVESLSRALAVELGPIRVNTVRLGPVPTGGVDLPNQEVMYKALRRQLLTRELGKPAQAAEAYLYLMRSGFATGTVMPVDGGYELAASPFLLAEARASAGGAG
ncbi:SDR family oxidoreductase [Micromonospora sp. NPDC023888]|uniref:SDR family oxidoreductase n=1 Tax=Micromonospora sp. NPDC023888 TaxID=3155607 RepID=UPI0033EF0596